jgi:hypothetical protein
VKPESEAELVALANKLSMQMSTDSDGELSQWSRAPSIDCLPATCDLPTSGFRINVRMIHPTEVGRYYDAFLEAATIDHGFWLEKQCI